MTDAKINLREGFTTTISSGGHSFVADEPLSAGGQNLGPTPMQMLAGSLGACVAITVKLYAERKSWPLEGVDVDVAMERFKGADYPAYQGDEDFVHEFKVDVALKGDLSDEQRARLMEIAGKCPVHRALTTPVFVLKTLVEPESA